MDAHPKIHTSLEGPIKLEEGRWLAESGGKDRSCESKYRKKKWKWMGLAQCKSL